MEDKSRFENKRLNLKTKRAYFLKGKPLEASFYKGRAIMHFSKKFDEGKIKSVNNKPSFFMVFLNPSKTLTKLSLKENWVAADFGCGSGGWVIPLSEKLERGKVYAIDILEEPLSALKSKLKLDKIGNVEIVKSDLEKTTKLLRNSCDLVLMTNLLFEIENKRGVMEEAKRVLREGGKLLIVDWKEESGSLGPENPVSSQEIEELAKDFGFQKEREFDAGVYHWALVFKKA